MKASDETRRIKSEEDGLVSTFLFVFGKIALIFWVFILWDILCSLFN